MQPRWQNVLEMLWQGVGAEEQNKIRALLQERAVGGRLTVNQPPNATQQEIADLQYEKLLSALGPFARSLRDALSGNQIVGWEEKGELVEVPQEHRNNLYTVADDIANAYYSLYDNTGNLLPDPMRRLRRSCLDNVARIMKANTEAEKIFKKIRDSFLKSGTVTINELQDRQAKKDRLQDLDAQNQEKQRQEKLAKERASKLSKGLPEFENLPKAPDWDAHAETAEDKAFLSVLVSRIRKRQYDGEYRVTCAMYENGQFYGEAESSTAVGLKGHPIAKFLLRNTIEMMDRDPRSCSEYTLLLLYLNDKFPNVKGAVNSLADFNINPQVRTVARAVGKIDGRWYVDGMDACLNCQQWLKQLGWTWAPGLASKV